MRIPPAFAESAVFLCDQRRGRPKATAFFVEHEEANRVWVYLVTARHCLEATASQDIYVRVNTFPDPNRSVSTEDVHTRKDDWFKHDSADIAVLPSPIDRQHFATQQIPLDLSIDRRYRFDVAALDGRGNRVLEPVLRMNFPEGIDVQVGDEVFSTGLFIQSAGRNRNLPIVRFGNIARMPGDEMVILSTRARGDIPIRAYLIETHSWGGFSGSPMFWHFQYNLGLPLWTQRWVPPQSESRFALPQRMPNPERIDVNVSRGWAIALLGVVSGHYDIPTSARNQTVETALDSGIAALNAGIAMVTPAEALRELIMSDELAEDRNRRTTLDREPAATADFADAQKERTTQETSAPDPKHRIEIPIPSRKQFMGDLKKATRKGKTKKD